MKDICPHCHREMPISRSDLDVSYHISKRLGVSPLAVRELALSLYGRSISAERDTRAKSRLTEHTPPSSARMIRAHITRDLIDEIRMGQQGRGFIEIKYSNVETTDFGLPGSHRDNPVSRARSRGDI